MTPSDTLHYIQDHLSKIASTSSDNPMAFIKLCHSILLQAISRTELKGKFVTSVDTNVIHTASTRISIREATNESHVDYIEEIYNLAHQLGLSVKPEDKPKAHEFEKLINLLTQCFKIIETNALAKHCWEPIMPPSQSLTKFGESELLRRDASFLDGIPDVEHNLRKIVNKSGLTFTIIDVIRNFATEKNTAIFLRAVNPYFRELLTAINLGFTASVTTPTGETKNIIRAHGKPLQVKTKGARDSMSAGGVAYSPKTKEYQAHCSKQITPSELNKLMENVRANPPIVDPYFGDGKTLIITSPDCRNCWRLVPIETEDSTQKYEVYNLWGVDTARETRELNLAGSKVLLLCGIDPDGEYYLIISDIDSAVTVADRTTITDKESEFELMNVDSCPKEVLEIREDSKSDFSGLGTLHDIKTLMMLNKAINLAFQGSAAKIKISDLIRHPSDVARPGEYTSIDNIIAAFPDGRVVYCDTKEAYGSVLEAMFESGKYHVPVHCDYPFDFIKPYLPCGHERLLICGQAHTAELLKPGAKVVRDDDARLSDVHTARRPSAAFPLNDAQLAAIFSSSPPKPAAENEGESKTEALATTPTHAHSIALPVDEDKDDAKLAAMLQSSPPKPAAENAGESKTEALATAPTHAHSIALPVGVDKKDSDSIALPVGEDKEDEDSNRTLVVHSEGKASHHPNTGVLATLFRYCCCCCGNSKASVHPVT